jgi:hypothetical protein
MTDGALMEIEATRNSIGWCVEDPQGVKEKPATHGRHLPWLLTLVTLTNVCSAIL